MCEIDVRAFRTRDVRNSVDSIQHQRPSPLQELPFHFMPGQIQNASVASHVLNQIQNLRPSFTPSTVALEAKTNRRCTRSTIERSLP